MLPSLAGTTVERIFKQTADIHFENTFIPTNAQLFFFFFQQCRSLNVFITIHPTVFVGLYVFYSRFCIKIFAINFWLLFDSVFQSFSTISGFVNSTRMISALKLPNTEYNSGNRWCFFFHQHTIRWSTILTVVRTMTHMPINCGCQSLVNHPSIYSNQRIIRHKCVMLVIPP